MNRVVAGDRVVLARAIGKYAGRAGTVFRACGEPFEDWCYVNLDPRPRERTQHRAFVEVDRLDPTGPAEAKPEPQPALPFMEK